MSAKSYLLLITLSAVAVLNANPKIGQSAIITLQFPYGAREAAMGECGVALADDQSCMFYNPAGLGVISESMNKGAAGHFFEPLLPALKLSDVWHLAAPMLVWQDNRHYFGGVGVSVNYLNFGRNDITNQNGVVEGQYNADEVVVGLSYGDDLLHDLHNGSSFAYGASFKYARSKLTNDNSQIGRTYAIDAALLGVTSFGLRMGGGLYNMGPAVSYGSGNGSQSNPIPFTVRIGIAWKYPLVIEGMDLLKVACEGNLDREIVRQNPDSKPDNFIRAIYDDVIHDTSETRDDEIKKITRHLGAELTVMNTGSFRFGYMIDPAGDRYETHWGFGVSVFNHISFDYAYIISPDDRPRNGQWSIGLNIFNITELRADDIKWWNHKSLNEPPPAIRNVKDDNMLVN